MKKYRKYLVLLLLLGLGLSVSSVFIFAFNTDDDYVNVIPETLSVQEGDLFDLAIDSNLDLSELTIISSDLETIRLEGKKLRALTVGRAFITVKSQNGSELDQVLINVNPLVREEPAENIPFEVIVDDEQFIFDEPISIGQLEAPSIDGYIFLGFSLQENGMILENDMLIDESLTLYSVYQILEEEKTEIPTEEEEVSESEDDESKNPDDNENEENIVSSPSSISITLESDQGTVMRIVTISPGALISEGAFDVDISEVGYFLKGSTCQNPFDFDTPLVTNTSLVLGQMNYTSPCINLDEMATTGKLQVGEIVQTYVSPSGATIKYEWYISEDGRDYDLIRTVTGASIELTAEYLRHHVAVKLTGTGDYIGSLSLPLGQVQQSQSAESLSEENLITSWADLASMKTGEESRDKTYTLSNDLDETSPGYLEFASSIANDKVGWIPIGSSEEPFMGSFDGNGYTIADLVINMNDDHAGLFGVVGADGTYENLTIEDVQISADDYVAFLIGKVDGPAQLVFKDIVISGGMINAIDDVGALIGGLESDLNTVVIQRFSGHYEIDAGSQIGGLIGYINAQNVHIQDVENTFVITGSLGSGDGEEIGGIIGDVQRISTMVMMNITTSGLITGDDDQLGGIIGEIDRGVITLSGIAQHSNIVSNHSSKAEAGGLVGDNDGDLRIINSTNYGSVIAINDRVGGFVGENNDNNNGTLFITNSFNYGTVQGNDGVGGFIGDNNSVATIHNSYNYGMIVGDEEIGGIIGDSSNATITESKNHGTIMGDDELGGLLGHSDMATINQSMNYGTITASSIDASQIGGLVGDGAADFEDYLTIFQSANLGGVFSSGDAVGGLVGYIHYGALDIRESYNSGPVIVGINEVEQANLGGIVGYVEYAAVTLSAVYNNATVSITDSFTTQSSIVGGLIGIKYSSRPISIINSYNNGLLTGTAIGSITIGGIVGVDEFGTTITSTYYLNTSAEYGYNNEGQNLSRSALSMTAIDTYTGWDIGADPTTSHVWSIGFEGEDTYPWLTWQDEPIDPNIISLLSLGYIPLASVGDIIAINSTDAHAFAAGTPYYRGDLVGGLNKNYVMVNDIDFSGVTNLTHSVIAGVGDGEFPDPFNGTFDGNNQIISNYVVNSGDSNSSGLFGNISGSTIRNLKLNSITLSGLVVGGLSGISNASSLVTNISVSNVSITYDELGGGLFGKLSGQNNLISGVSISGEISESGLNNSFGIVIGGGLVGFVEADLRVYNINQTASITGSYIVGGLIGFSGDLFGSSVVDITGDSINSLSSNTGIFSSDDPDEGIAYGTIIGVIFESQVNITDINDGVSSEAQSYFVGYQENHLLDDNKIEFIHPD